jgi:diguanylate cyclase (GGDEF)-like protein
MRSSTLTNQSRALRRWTSSLAFRLYSLIVLAVLSIVTLVFVGSHTAQLTAAAAMKLSDDGLSGIVRAAELEVLIEKHRRLVESAPAEADRRQIALSRQLLEAIERSILTLTAGRPDDTSRSVTADMPELQRCAARVLMLAENFSWDAATDAVDIYSKAAQSIQASIRQIRSRQQSEATTMVERLIASAHGLIYWGTTVLLTTLVILAPLSLLVLGDAARRLRLLWWGMFRIARNDIKHHIPSLHDLDEIGDMARAVQIFKENTIALADKRTEIEQVNRFLDIALNNMARGLSMFDAAGKLVLCNDTYRRLYDLPEQFVVPGAHWSEIAAFRNTRLASTETHPQTGISTLDNLSARTTLGESVKANQTLRDGRIIAVATQPLSDGGWVAIHEDVTQQSQTEARIARLASVDTLTGLANRHTLREQIDARCRETKPAPFALLLIDLDRFKQVNDTLGHPAGDRLLEIVAKRLQQATRATDCTARLGGDEFAVLQDNAATPESALLLASRLIDNLTEPYLIDGQRVVIGASIGIACFPDQGTTMTDLFGYADLALYASKFGGRGTATIFDPIMKEAVLRERALEADLCRAIAEKQFELFYQPILSLETGRTVSCEALLRWRHPERGLIPPLEFIPFAEQTGLIIPIGRWALQQACRDALSWPAHIGVAVNLSAAQVITNNLPADIQEILTQTGLAPNRLELEVTETLLLDDEPTTRETLLQIRESGVRIALDDFGTGYASLGYLRRFPFDKLKIDQVFVREITDRKASTAIVRAVASMAKSLNMTTVAEGVETEQHLARVAAAGCTQVQGYLFSKPVPAKEIARIISTCAVPKLDHEIWLQQAAS